MKSVKLFSQFALPIAFIFAFSALLLARDGAFEGSVCNTFGFVWMLITVFSCRPVSFFRKSVLPNQQIPLIS